MARARVGKRVGMLTLALTVLAQHSQKAPDSGTGAGLIIATIVGVIVAMALIWFVFTRVTRRTRGGVDAPEGSQHRGNPPVEGIRRGG